MTSIYTSGEYLEFNPTWHSEDAPWKANQIYNLLRRNYVSPKLVAEVGCGAGAILSELSQKPTLSNGVEFRGYDISPQAIKIARSRSADRITFFCEDLFSTQKAGVPDVLLVIDVFEHVPDYIGFIAKCRVAAKFKVYHIPLDIHASSVLRDTFDSARQNLGHLHYFTASSAIATLKDTGHEIVEQCYTRGALGLFSQHPSIKRGLANIPRWLLSKVSVAFTARLLGGYSLLVLAR